MRNPWLWFLNTLAGRLDFRVISNEHKQPYLYRGYLWGWRPPVECPACEGGMLPICDYCHGTGQLPYQKQTRTNLYLHHFLRGDSDDAPHSHPWPWAISFVLWGGYTEERLIEVDGLKYLKTRRVWPFTFNFLRGGDELEEADGHRVVKLHGQETWTLFLTGPKSTSWAFYVFGRGWVPWRQRLKERGINVQEEV